MQHERRHDGDLGLGQPLGYPSKSGGVEVGPASLRGGPPRIKAAVVRRDQSRGVSGRCLGHAAHVLDRRNTDLGGGDRVGHAQMGGHLQVERFRLIDDRAKQGRIDPGVHLDQIRSCRHQSVDAPAGIFLAVDADGIGIRGGESVNHGAGGVDSGAPGRTAICNLAQLGDGGGSTVYVAYGGDAPGEIPGRSPGCGRAQMGVCVDQSGDDPTTGNVHLAGPPGQLEPASLAHRFNAAAAHHDHGIPHRWSVGAIDQRGADQRNSVAGRTLAAEKQQTGQGEAAALASADHWMSDRGESSSLGAAVALPA